MMDYCQGPTCGWFKKVDEQGLCADCRNRQKLESDSGKMLQRIVSGMGMRLAGQEETEKERRDRFIRWVLTFVFLGFGMFFAILTIFTLLGVLP